MENYVWVLALAASWCQRSSDEPDGPEIARIDAVAGQFRQPVSNAANDLTACVIVLMWFWWWSCAKSRAKLIDSSAFSRKLLAAVFFPAIPLKPAWLARSGTDCHG